MSLSRQEKLAALGILIAPLIFFFPATIGQIVLCPDDGWMINLPLRVVAARLFLDGEFPLWNPYVFGGMPLLGTIQGGVLFPPNWAFWILKPQHAVNFVMLFAYAMAGLGAYCYARRTGASIAGAFVTGFVWQFCGFMVAPLGHMSSIQAASLLPWVLWGIESYAMSGRRFYAVLITVFISLQIFAGHPQTFVYSTFLVVSYLLVMAFWKRTTRRFYLYSLIMILGGIALSAIQILPTMELSQYSLRREISYEFFTSFSLPPSFLLNFFAPYATGGSDGLFFQMPYTGAAFYSEYIGYIGVTVLMLAIVAFVVKPNIQTYFWGILALICLLLAIGDALPFCLNRIAYAVLGLNLFRVPARHLMEVDFALAVLAGRGLTAIVSLQGKEQIKRIIGVGVGVLILTIFAVSKSSDGRIVTEVWCPVVLAICGLILMWLLARGFHHAVTLTIIVIVFDLCLWGQFSGWRMSPKYNSEIFNPTPVINFLRQQQNDEEVFRVLSLVAPDGTESSLSLHPNIYMLNGLQNAAGYDAFGSQRFTSFTDGMKEWGELSYPLQSLREDNAFNLLNVRYLIAKRTADGRIITSDQSFDEKLIADRWHFLRQFDDVGIYENKDALPRAWQVTKAAELPDETETLNIIRTRKFSDGSVWTPQREVLIDTLAAPSLKGEYVETHTVITNYSANRISLKTNCIAPTVLILAENYYPGWTVNVDGQNQELLRVNYNLRGVVLSAGGHDVEFIYRPKSFLTGSIISLLSAFLLIFWWRKTSKKVE